MGIPYPQKNSSLGKHVWKLLPPPPPPQPPSLWLIHASIGWTVHVVACLHYARFWASYCVSPPTHFTLSLANCLSSPLISTEHTTTNVCDASHPHLTSCLLKHLSSSPEYLSLKFHHTCIESSTFCYSVAFISIQHNSAYNSPFASNDVDLAVNHGEQW